MASRRRDGPRRRSERRLRGHRGVSPPRPFVAGDLARRSGWRGAETEVLSIRTDEVRWDSGPHLPDRIHRRSRIRDLGRARTGRGAVGRRPGEGPGTRHHTRGDARTRHRSDRSGAHSGGGRVHALAESNHRRANVFAVGAQPGLDHRGGQRSVHREEGAPRGTATRSVTANGRPGN